MNGESGFAVCYADLDHFKEFLWPFVTNDRHLTYALILGLAWGIVVAVSPWQASRYLMARNEHTVIRSATITANLAPGVDLGSALDALDRIARTKLPESAS